MSKKGLLVLLVGTICFVTFYQTTNAEISVFPPNPTTCDEIKITVTVRLGWVDRNCGDYIPEYSHSIDGNNITLHLIASTRPLGCIQVFGVPHTFSITEEIGKLPPGQYSVRGEITSGLPPPTSVPDIPNNSFIFSVADIIHVPDDQPTIQAGIDVALDGDTVLVADGTYTGDGNKNLDFKGKAITVKSENGAENCIIDCEGDGRGFYFHSGETEEAIVSGFTVKKAHADFGSGVYCHSNSLPTITNNIIEENDADTGGGIYCSHSSPLITNNTIKGNVATVGGGIACTKSSPLIKNNIIMNNSAGDNGNGGGIMLGGGSSPIIQNNIIEGNSAGITGGGIAVHPGGSPMIQNNTIRANSASHGGGIRSYSSSPFITNNIIEDNDADFSGGGISIEGGGTPTIQNNIIRRNYTGSSGGGIKCDSTSPFITNNIIEDNNADFGGGGIYCRISEPLIINNTIVRNYTEGDGGGIYCSYESFPTVLNTILWDNIPDQIDVYFSAIGITVTYSDIQGGFTGEGNIDSDPLFVDTDNGIYYLGDRSPCIGGGQSEGAPETDIVGRERGTPPDIGAYENPLNNPLQIGDVSGDRTISAYDAALILQYVVGIIDVFPADSPIVQAAQKYIAGEITIDELDRILQSFGYPSVFKLLGYENKLLQNYPNPFNPDTWIPFKLAQDTPVTISIYDTKGQLIRTISLGNKQAGIYTTKDKAVYWDGKDRLGQKVSSGVYYYQMQAGEYKAMRKMVIVK